MMTKPAIAPRITAQYIGKAGTMNLSQSKLMRKNTSRDTKNLSPHVVVQGKKPLRGLVSPTNTARTVKRAVTLTPVTTA